MGNMNSKGKKSGLKKSGGKNVASIFTSPPPPPCKPCKPCCPPKNNNTVLIVVLIVLLILIIFVVPLITKNKILKWYNDYNTYNTKKTFSTILYIYYFESNLLYKLCNLLQPESYQLNRASWYYISHLIETCGSDQIDGWVIPYNLTTSLAPFNMPNDDGTTSTNSPCRWTWNWAVYGANNDGSPIKNINNMTDKNIQYKALINAIDPNNPGNNVGFSKLADSNDNIQSSANFIKNVKTAAKQFTSGQNNNLVDNNGNLLFPSDWKTLIEMWGSFWVKNDDNLYMLGIDQVYMAGSDKTPNKIRTPYGTTTIGDSLKVTSSMTASDNYKMTPSQCRDMWFAQGDYKNIPFYQSNFLAQVWGIPPDSPLVEAFVTGASISGSGQKLYPDLLSRLLGVNDGMINNGWTGFLNELNPKSEAEIKRVVYGEDVNIKGTNKLLKDTTSDSNGAESPNQCKNGSGWAKILTSGGGAGVGILAMSAIGTGGITLPLVGFAILAAAIAGTGTAASEGCI